MKTILSDLSAKAGNESCLYPACRGHSPHNERNGKFCTGKRFSCHGNKICNQIGHILVLVERRQYMKVCDVRSMRGAEIESDHFLERTKI